MSLGLWPTFDPELKEVKFEADGAFLLNNCEKLDKLAIAKGLKPISAFGDKREVPEDFEGDPFDIDEVLGEWDEWFSAKEGLKTVEGLLAVLDSDSKAARKFKDFEYVVGELEELARCLRIAAKKRAKWRFALLQ